VATYLPLAPISDPKRARYDASTVVEQHRLGQNDTQQLVSPISFDNLVEQEDDDSPNDVVNFVMQMGKMTMTQWRVQYQSYWVISKHMCKMPEINAFLSDHGCKVPWNCCIF
jgi:hypothetical protein